MQSSRSAPTTIPPWIHALRIFSTCASARNARLRGSRVPATGHSAWQDTNDQQQNVVLSRVCDGPCNAGSREESAGAAAAVRLLCLALRLRMHRVPVITRFVSLILTTANAG
jgi:hypothetical protein